MAEEWERGWLAAVRSSAVMKQESDLDVISRREGSRITVGEELKSHRRGVVGDAVEIRACGGELGQPEEGLEVGICTELNVELALAGHGNRFIKAFHDLARKSGTGDSTDGVGGVVREVPFMKIGQLSSLEKHIISENFVGVEGSVVDLSNIDQIPN